MIKYTVVCALRPFHSIFFCSSEMLLTRVPRNPNSGANDWILFTHPTCSRKKTTLPLLSKVPPLHTRSSGAQQGTYVVFSPSSREPGISLSRRQDIGINRSLFHLPLGQRWCSCCLTKTRVPGSGVDCFAQLRFSSSQWLLFRAVPLPRTQLGKGPGQQGRRETAFSSIPPLMFTVCY